MPSGVASHCIIIRVELHPDSVFALRLTDVVRMQVNVVIKGTVQGVFYRKWTVGAAQKLGLNGWVRNLQDGSVEAVFSGPSSAVDDIIQQCHSGPSKAKVSSVDVSKWDHEVPHGFEKRKTS